MRPLRSIPDVCDIEIISSPVPVPARSDSPPTLLIEVPHGATKRRHFEATRSHLEGDFPEYLEEFFFVNTDVGSIECARSVARMVTNPGAYPELAAFESEDTPGLVTERGNGRAGADRVVIVRGLVARTFIDLNRVIRPEGTDLEPARSADPAGPAAPAEPAEPAERPTPNAMTPGLPEYVTEPQDVATLRRMHADYQALAARAYEAVFDEAGSSSANATALILHTYAPRTVEIDRLDGSTLAALRQAYEPEVFETLARRPDVDLITEAANGSLLAPAPLAASVRENYARIGIDATENATYRLHDATMGSRHSVKYPGRVLCMEINRTLLAEEFTPFEEMSISETKARRMAAPIAAAFLRQAAG